VTKQDVLFIDNIFRFVQAGSEVSALLGRMPAAGDTNRLWQRNGRFARAHHLHNRRVNYVNSSGLRPSRRLTDPAPATTFALLTNSCLCGLASKGIYQLLTHWTRLPPCCSGGDEHYNTPPSSQSTLQRYKELQDIIAILGLDELSEDDRVTVA